jgi:TRAP-type C4-dicarboxylate transport system permease small subunit
MIGWQAYRLVREEAGWGDMVLTDIPLWLVHAIVPVAFMLISYQFLVRVVKLLHGLFGPEPDEAAS